MPKPYLILLILWFCTGVAYATPTVTEVENTIASGDYVKAKAQLHEVLKRHPDSIVATTYLLEVMKIEYAESLVPSVEYKLYEQRLLALQKAKVQRALDEIEAKRIADDKAARAKFMMVLKWMFYTFIAIALTAAFSFLGLRYVKNKQRLRAERERKREWLSEANASLIDIHNALTDLDVERFERHHTQSFASKRIALLDANYRYMEQIQSGVYDEDTIDSHLYAAYRYKRDYIDPLTSI